MAGIGGQSWAFLAAIRVPNASSSEDDIASATPRIFWESGGAHGSPKWPLFFYLIAAKGGLNSG